MGRMVFNMIGVFAEFEREMIVERVNAGIQNAKNNGVTLGRKKLNPLLLERAYDMYLDGSHTIKEIVTVTQVSRASIYRYIKSKETA
jgi:DNA invertase Pin-like site-specific DNA recombinase